MMHTSGEVRTANVVKPCGWYTGKANPLRIDKIDLFTYSSNALKAL
jgi:hypothetical protein